MTITVSLHGHDAPEFWRLWNGPTLLGAVHPDVDIEALKTRCEIILAATESLSAVRIELVKANQNHYSDRPLGYVAPYTGDDPF